MSYFDFEEKGFYESFLKNKSNKIKSYINDNEIIKEEINKFDKTINNIFNKIKNDQGKKFLVAGYVQGGKTDFAIGLNGKIIDEYKNQKNIFIHLTSSNKKIVDQNYNRFDQFFSNSEIDKSETSLIKKNKNILEEFINSYSTNNNIILFFMKNVASLKYVNQIVDYLKNNNCNIFIFDDEGDNASFNTNDNTVEFQEEKSKIFNELTNIINIDSNCKIKYVSITATPMIHLLSNEKSELKPDYCFVLQKSYGYTGIEEFINESNNSKSKLFIEINEDENSNNDLKISLITFFIKALFVKKKDIDFGNDSQPIMIINRGYKKEEHNETKEIVENITNILFGNEYDLSKDIDNLNIINFLDDKLQSIIKRENICTNYLAQNIIKNFKNRYKVIIFNSNEKNDENDEDFENFNSYIRIIIGAYKMSRGITFNNLLQAYISYKPNTINADNVMQQCRWFGYRKKYLSHISLFMKNDFFQIYNDILNMEQALYEQMIIFEKEEKKFSEMERFLKLSQSPYSPIFGTYNNRAKQEIIQKQDISSHIIKNNFNIYKNDTFDFLKTNFDSQNIKINIYPYVEFNTFKEFVNDFIGDNNLEEIFGFSINEVKEMLFLLNQKTIVRFINNSLNVEYKERIVTSDDTVKYYWGNGTYKEHDKGLEQNEINYIDLLPLKIYKRNKLDISNNSFEKYIFRLKLNLNQKIISEFKSFEFANYIKPKEK